MIDPFRFPRKKQGDRIVVSCVVSTGDQPLEIAWTKDGDNIPPDMGIQIQVHSIYIGQRKFWQKIKTWMWRIFFEIFLHYFLNDYIK